MPGKRSRHGRWRVLKWALSVAIFVTWLGFMWFIAARAHTPKADNILAHAAEQVKEQHQQLPPGSQQLQQQQQQKQQPQQRLEKIAEVPRTSSSVGTQPQDPVALAGSPPSLTCTFRDGVDYVGPGPEELVEKLSDQQCCELCKSRNDAKPGSCMVGVLSADYDSPPRACWLKGHVSKAIPKKGVRSCWPSKPPKGLDDKITSDIEHTKSAFRRL